MRLSDAGLRQRQTKALYPNHRPPPWLNEDAAPRSLEPIVRWHPTKLRPSSPTSLTDPLPITASPELSPAASSNNQTRRRPTKEQSVGTRRFKSPRSHSSSLRRPIPTTPFLQMSSNDEVERRGVASTQNEGTLSQSSTPSLAHRRCGPAIARTDC